MSVPLIQALPWTAGLLALAGSAASDLRTRTIPDSFAIFIALCGLIMAVRPEAREIWIAIPAAAGVLLTFGVLAHFHAIGGGDAKLIAATCLLVRPEHIPLLLVEIALAGGVLSCLYLAGGYLLRQKPSLYRAPPGAARPGAFRKWLRREGARMARGFPMPYALAVLGGAAYHFMRELLPCFSATSCSL